MTLDPAQQVHALEEVCRAAVELTRSMSADEAALPTDCPGWSVQDHLAHMVGLETVLAGAPEPDVELPHLDHVTTEIDAYMERHVHARRALSIDNIADELDGLLPRRIDQLQALVAEGDPEMPAPMGTTRALSLGLPMRVFDLWTHEQDMRRALGRPMRLDGLTGPFVAERILTLWTMALPRNEEIPPGRLTVRVTAPTEAEATIELGDGGSTATLVGDLEVTARLLCGRGASDEVLERATVEGDRAWFDTLTPHLVLTP